MAFCVTEDLSNDQHSHSTARPSGTFSKIIRQDWSLSALPDAGVDGGVELLSGVF
jgi:hypothetical protein